MSEIVRTPPTSNLDRVLATKRALRNAREAHDLSRAQLARMLGHDSDRLVRAWEDEDTENRVPVDALMNPDVPSTLVAFIIEKVLEARGEGEPMGADSPAAALCALERGAGQFIVWKGTVGLAAVTPNTAAQGLKLVELLCRQGTVAARFLRRAITGAHPAARGKR